VLLGRAKNQQCRDEPTTDLREEESSHKGQSLDSSGPAVWKGLQEGSAVCKRQTTPTNLDY